MKDFMFDYRDHYGFSGRYWIAAETIEAAKEKAKNTCAITGWELLSVKECHKSGAAKTQTAALFEQHARSFIGDSE